jgi:hypothetical protein
MNIALLCISVEPGRDGVGDYTRQLARALVAHGHRCQVVALADRFVDRPMAIAEGVDGFEIVRIPVSHWRRTDIGLAVGHLKQFKPDWVSLQMVCYGFEERGLLWRSAGRFAGLRAAFRRHIMFHELWIGESRNSPARERVVGCLQRRLLLRATRAWAPSVIHTSNPVYREMLRRADIDAEELALPGNIPVRRTDFATARSSILARLRSLPGRSAEPLLAGVFGSIHPEWNDAGWMLQLATLCAQLNRRLVITQFGRPGASGAKVLAELRSRTIGKVEFLELGELPPDEISVVLQSLDFGVATTPWPLIGKSGTVAAMLEHGLSVLVTREGDALRSGPIPAPASHPQLFRLREFCGALEAGTLPRVKPEPRLDVYERFIGALERAS